MYTVCVNAVYIAAEHSFTKKSYKVIKTIWLLNENQKSKALDISAEGRSDSS